MFSRLKALHCLVMRRSGSRFSGTSFQISLCFDLPSPWFMIQPSKMPPSTLFIHHHITMSGWKHAFSLPANAVKKAIPPGTVILIGKSLFRILDCMYSRGNVLPVANSQHKRVERVVAYCQRSTLPTSPPHPRSRVVSCNAFSYCKSSSSDE